MIAFVFTGILLLVELLWPNSDVHRLVHSNNADIYLSALGALSFLLISTLVAPSRAAGAVSANCKD